MKKVKYTNTNIKPLEIKSIKTVHSLKTIYDYEGNFIASIYRIRNHSKNESAKSAVLFYGKKYIFDTNCDTIITWISNSYLFWNLYYKNKKLMYKLFDSNSIRCPFVLDLYVSGKVVEKLYREGFFNEKE